MALALFFGFVEAKKVPRTASVTKRFIVPGLTFWTFSRQRAVKSGRVRGHADSSASP